MELWDVYDRNRRTTGETMQRGGVFKENTYHLVVHVCIFNSKGEMLIQQRQPFKKGWSNMWDVTVGGSAVAGDDSIKAAEREVFEEIGYEIDLSEHRPTFCINFDKGFDDFYLVEQDLDLTHLKLQQDEVQQVKWATQEEIHELIERNQFIPYHKTFISFIFDMIKYKGIFSKGDLTKNR